jgi:hypothetical protein
VRRCVLRVRQGLDVVFLHLELTSGARGWADEMPSRFTIVTGHEIVGRAQGVPLRHIGSRELELEE